MTDDTGQEQGEEYNPYRAPVAEVAGASPGRPEPAAPGEPTEETLRLLAWTGPWALLLSILGFIGCGLLLLSGMSAIVLMPFLENAERPGSVHLASSVLALAGAFYLVLGASSGVVSYALARHGAALARAGRSRGLAEVEAALGAGYGFWRTSGIVAICVVVFLVLFVLAVASVPTFVLPAPSS